MESAVDPFHPLLRILDRYRADVHHLRAGAPERTVDDPHGPPIPASLRAFLVRWNGAVLFRGVLRVRSAVDINPDAPLVVRRLHLFEPLEATEAMHVRGAVRLLRWRQQLDATLRATTIRTLRLQALPAPARERVELVDERLHPDTAAAELPRQPIQADLQA